MFNFCSQNAMLHWGWFVLLLQTLGLGLALGIKALILMALLTSLVWETVATLLWRQYDLFHPERLPSTLNLCAAIQHFASVSGGPFCRSSSTKACQAFLVVQRKATCIYYTFIPRVLKAAAASKVGRSGRFVKQEQWERWRAKRKLVSGSKQREWGGEEEEAFLNFWDCICKSCNPVHFGRKAHLRKTVRNAFLNTNNGDTVSMRSCSFSITGTAFPLEITATATPSGPYWYFFSKTLFPV